MAKLFGADPEDADVRAGATLVTLALLKILQPELSMRMDDE